MYGPLFCQLWDPCLQPSGNVTMVSAVRILALQPSVNVTMVPSCGILALQSSGGVTMVAPQGDPCLQPSGNVNGASGILALLPSDSVTMVLMLNQTHTVSEVLLAAICGNQFRHKPSHSETFSINGASCGILAFPPFDKVAMVPAVGSLLCHHLVRLQWCQLWDLALLSGVVWCQLWDPCFATIW